MPTYKEGHLYVLGEGATPPTTVPDKPEKHWFELRVLFEGLRLVHFPEECDYKIFQPFNPQTPTKTDRYT